MKKIQGAITALVTPFTKDGSLDLPALRSLVKFQLENGINALVPCGSTGEAATMTNEEYQLVIKTVLEEVNGQVPVIAGAGSNDTQKAIHFSQLAKQAGADMLLHVTPFYNKPTVAGLKAHYQAIADAVDLPIILYNVPGRTGLNCTAAMTLSIAREIPEIVGVKEASGDISQMMEIIQSTPNNFSVLSGDDSLTLPLIAAGGDGCISVVANEVPKQFTEMTQKALAGDIKSAREMHYALLPLMDANFIETNPQPVKTALHLMGMIEESFRLPLVPMATETKAALRAVLKEQGLI